VVQVLNPIVVSTATNDTSVTWCLWGSCGEDMEFMKPASFYSTSTSVGEAETVVNPIAMDTDIRRKFREPFESMAPAQLIIPVGISIGQEVVGFSDLLHRYQVIDQGWNSTYPLLYCIYTILPTQYHELVPRVFWTFHFNRGGWRFKLLSQSNTGMVKISNATVRQFDLNPYPPLSEQEASNGLMVESMQLRPGASWTVPFYYSFNMFSRYWSLDHANTELPCFYANLGDVPFDDIELYVSTNDDFTFGWPRNPPAFTSVAP